MTDPVADPVADPLARLVDLEGVPSAYAAARDGIDVMLRDRGLRRTSPEMTAESLLRGAHATAVLEGSTSSLAEIRAGDGDAIAQDALRLSASQLAPAPLLRTAPLQAIARLHAVVAGGSVPDDALGRPRDAASADRLRGVSGSPLSATRAPALLVAAVVHADVATAAPFASHNGIVARALERLVLVARGVDAKSLVVPEAVAPRTARAVRAQPACLRRRRAARRARLGDLRRRGVRRRRRGVTAAAYGRVALFKRNASGTRPRGSDAVADT